MSADFPHDCQFRKLLAGRADICLPGLMLEFAADACPDVDSLACLAEIDRLGCLARQRAARVPAGEGVIRRLEAVSQVLYGEEGFSGNKKCYYDPRNSLLNEVLRTRRGLPIALGILYMSVAARAGLTMFGVATPGHFVVACQPAGDEAASEPLYVDPFSAGDVLTREGCRRRIQETVGGQQRVEDRHFRRATGQEIAVRVLRNLKTAYALKDAWRAMLPVQKRLTLLLPQAADERRDLGLVYLRIGQARRALEMLERYMQDCGPEQAEEVRPYLRSARRLTAELN